MWKFISILLLIMLIGCGQTQQNTTSDQADQETANDQNDENKVIESIGENAVHGNQNNKEKEMSSSSLIKDPEYGVLPKTIKIHSIGVESAVEHVGLMKDGEMAVPENFRITGWYNKGPKPGERGSAVIAGHVDDKTGPGVFFDLKKLHKGNEIEILNDEGEKQIFKVVGKDVFPMDDAPVNDIFGYTPRRMLNLVTCTGPFDRSKGGHIDRLVVYTELQPDK